MVLKQFSSLTEVHQELFQVQNELELCKERVKSAVMLRTPDFLGLGEKSVQVHKDVTGTLSYTPTHIIDLYANSWSSSSR